MQKLDGKTQNIVADNVDQLQQLFPEAFTEGKIDFDMLRNLLGDNVDSSEERYSFNWHGKSDAIKIALKQSSGTLRPDRESSKNWDDTENLYIEGDNLEVLRIMQSSYRNKVKMIYIDPPYGIKYGSNFQPFTNKRDVKDRKDEDLTQEPEMIKAFRDTWELGIHSYLSYLRDRLLLSKELLTASGSVFVQIGDENLHHVRVEWSSTL